MQFQIPKGLFDILPYEADHDWKLSFYWKYLEDKVRKISEDYGYKEIRTPIFEKTELFVRSVGETSDIVKKEMYNFFDKAGRPMSLRPEGTACIIRAYIENNLHNTSFPNKFYYMGPMFRYDRPQAGRYRQHHQFGIEVIGTKNYEQDVEVIDLLWEFYKRTGLKNLTLYINSIGDSQSRENYKKALKKHLKPYYEKLSKDSKERFEKNPLRILDSKEKQDQELLKNAPSIEDFLTKSSKDHFEKVCNLLKDLNIPYIINKKLVRGLDYYNSTVFEVVSGELGAQNSIGGGGRYDGLVKSFGGPDLSAIGFGTGLERILQTMIEQKIVLHDPSYPFLYFIPLDEESKKLCFFLTTQLRHLEIPTDISLNIKKLQKSLKIASNLEVKYSAIIGEEERKSKKIVIKDMEKRDQTTVDLDKCIDFIKNLWSKNRKK